MTVTELPRPAPAPRPDQAPRWRPARAGIINVWRYYDEVFTFHEGRLLLRGPNGSGKSKALELLLPFLLDANLRASRLSTFGTGERTMHWNLMGEGASGTTRVGYVWLEFRFPGTPDRWFCCGCRLAASTHTTAVHTDYFTTGRRIGTPDGVALVNPAGQPLTRNALEEALGAEGVVHGNAGDYRTAVRAALFPGLAEQRYDALITALLQLRMPKLSQRLDPAQLSTLLSRALPPLGQQEITDLAEGFERLDRQRERLVTLDQEVAATRLLAARQRSYAQRVLRGRAAALISATTDLDNQTKTARHSAEEYEVVAARKAAAQARGETLESEAGTTEARVAGITGSEAYQQGRELDNLRQQAVRARDQAGA
ncbi:MAG: TIGR02680 family protein, partial [Actinomycetota bacterium]|nr:TIGR02680 family protein [Actinomycetota bacterium]